MISDSHSIARKRAVHKGGVIMAVKRALISVSDKTGVVDFARGLHELGVEIISTGGTMKAIADAGIPVKSVSGSYRFPGNDGWQSQDTASDDPRRHPCYP